MKKQLNEVKRMQLLAGLITESQLSKETGNKVKIYIDDPNYEPDEDGEDEDNESSKYIPNTNAMLAAIKEYAAQNNIKLNPKDLESYEETFDEYGYAWEMGDDGYEFDTELTPEELYKDFVNQIFANQGYK